MALSDALKWFDALPGETAQYISESDLKNAIIQVYNDMAASIAAVNINEVTIQPGTPPTGTEIWIDTDENY